MKRLAHNNRRDANEPEIVKDLQRIGAKVKRLQDDDLLVGWRGVNYLFEVKTEDGVIEHSQAYMLQFWPGQYAIIRSSHDALRIMFADDAQRRCGFDKRRA